MDELTQLIKKNIKQNYYSMRRFAEELGIPQTTIVSAVKNGVGGTAFTTVCKICNALDIKLVNGIYPVTLSDNTKNLVEKLSKLDEKGIHTVTTVLEMEYIRCQAEAETIAIAQKNAKTDFSKNKTIISTEKIPTKSAVSEFLKALDE